jgi:hypothetical protein
VKLGQIIAGGACGENDCPTIALADEGMLDVQGNHQTGIETQAGETVVRIPVSLILEAARALGG